MRKNILILIALFFLSACVGSSSGGVFGTGVSVALDPRTLGTQIDDSIMQKNLLARLALTEKKYLIKISIKVLGSKATLTPVPNTPLVDDPTQEFSKINKTNNIKIFFILFF